MNKNFSANQINSIYIKKSKEEGYDILIGICNTYIYREKERKSS
jgi:hypothetical protein